MSGNILFLGNKIFEIPPFFQTRPGDLGENVRACSLRFSALNYYSRFFGKSLEENKDLEEFCSQVIKLINSILSTVDGGWGPWVEWSLCSSSCGLGTQTRFRYCDNPSPAYGGRACTGPRLGSRNCNRGLCPGIVYSSFIADF